MAAFETMKTLYPLVLLVLVACTGDAPLPSVPSPVLDGLPVEVAATLTAAHNAALEHPDNAGDAGRYGMLLQAYQQDGAAGQMYSRASALAPQDHRWNYYLAFMLESAGDSDAAIAAYQNAVRIDSSYMPGQLRLADLLLKLGREKEAGDIFMAILKSDPTFIPAGVGLGQALLAVGDEAAAGRVFERVLTTDTTNATAHYGMAQIQRSLGDADDAAEHLRLFEQYSKVTRLSPDRLLSEIGELNQSDRPSMQRARNSVSRGDAQGAIGHFEEAIRRNPANSSARVSLVGLYAAVGDYDNAEKYYNEALSLVPDNGKLHFSYAFSQQRRGNHEAAVEIFGRALALNPDDADAHAYLGVSQLALDDLDAALLSLGKAVAINPQQREGNARLGQLYLANGHAQDAIPLLEKATRRDDRYSITYLILLADAWQQSDNPDAAIEVRQRALALARQFGDERADALAQSD